MEKTIRCPLVNRLVTDDFCFDTSVVAEGHTPERFLPDELYIQLNYFAHFKKFANLKKPVTYNEKLNWLKLHDHNPLYTTLVDKYEVKKYVEKIIGGGVYHTDS